jgi:hypothetical protein
VDVQGVGGEDKTGQVTVGQYGLGSSGSAAGGRDVVDQRQHLGDPGGVVGDPSLADDDALAVHQGGEQFHLDIERKLRPQPDSPAAATMVSVAAIWWRIPRFLRGSLTTASASSKLARPLDNSSTFRSITRFSFLVSSG